MIKTAIAEVKKRFASEEENRLKQWDKEHPKPEPPPSTAVLKDFRLGNGKLDATALRKTLSAGDGWGEEAFLDIVSCPCIARWLQQTEEHKTAREGFKTALAWAKQEYLDRVLFDHDNAYLLLRDFKRWKPED